MASGGHQEKRKKPKGLRMSIGAVKNKKYGFVTKSDYSSSGALFAAAKTEFARDNVKQVVLCK